MTRQPSERTRFEVLLEAVRADQRTLAEGHSLLDAKIDRLIQQMNEQFAMANQQLVAVTQCITQRIGGVETAVLDLSQRLTVHERVHHN
ncbi:MAG: hypothetical protein HY600_07395 [Candidatus Omnitrophica bacterium]|nr:hypothetical protein [Candidatus Omnitrophota bacterium]